jgi:outer membrane receptor for ferrienterochelin and colicins
MLMKKQPIILTLTAIVFQLVCISAFASEIDTTDKSLFDRSIEELIEQEVTIATKSSQKLSQTPSVVSVITADEIKTMGYRELEEVLQTIPGFASTQTRLGSRPYAIRGVSNIRQGGKLLVLLDGTPYNDVMYGTSVFFGATFNLDAIERIEVIRGPGSALYGRNAFSGVINIITKRAQKDNNIEFGGTIGNYSTADGHLSYSIKKENFNARIDAKYYTTNTTDSKYNDGEGGESIWNIGHENIYINANAQYKNFKFYGSFAQRIDGNSSGINLGDFMANGSSTFKVGTYNLSYANDLSSNIGLKAKFYGRNENRIQDLEFSAPTTTDTLNVPAFGLNLPFNQFYQGGWYALPVFDAYTYGAEIELSFQILKNNKLLVGLQGDLHGVKNAKVHTNYDIATWLPLTYNDGQGNTLYYTRSNMPLYEPGWIQNNGHDYQNAAIYFQDVHYLLDNLSFTIGGRLDFDSEVGSIFNPRLGMVWEPSSHASIKLLYGKAYRAPTPNEQYKIMGFDLGNENLTHEEIHTGEAAISLQFEKLFTELSFYYNHLDNLILQLDTAANSTVKSYYNKGSNNSYGLELETKYFINNSIYTFANYSYNQSEDSRKLESGTITYRQPNVASHIVNLGVNTRFLRFINWSLLLRYTGAFEKFPVDYASNRSTFISQNKVGDFYMLNSTVMFTNLIKELDISIQGYNLLNSTYYYQDDTFMYQPKQPGRHFLVRASYNFVL